jgi:hypothetical protein
VPGIILVAAGSWFHPLCTAWSSAAWILLKLPDYHKPDWKPSLGYCLPLGFSQPGDALILIGLGGFAAGLLATAVSHHPGRRDITTACHSLRPDASDPAGCVFDHSRRRPLYLAERWASQPGMEH